MRVSTNPQFLIGRPPEKSGSIATALLGAAVLDLSYEWEEAQFPVPTMTLVQPVSVSAVRDFCDKISKLGATAVMVEETEADVQHVTTFLPDRSREVEAEIYKIEAEIIGKYPDVTLEFHVRVVPKDLNGVPELPSGRYYLLTWHAA